MPSPDKVPITLKARIDQFIDIYGTLHEVSRQLRVDVGYLSRLRTGKMVNPSDVVLAKLGLRAETTYYRTRP